MFMAAQPKRGRRFVQAGRHRKRPDLVRFLRDLSKRYPKAKRILLVLDHLNAHNEKSLLETPGGKRAKRVLRRGEWHPTPTCASGPNVGEIEVSMLTKPCLLRRLSGIEDIGRPAAVWSRDHNRRKAAIRWTFNHTDARRVPPELCRKNRLH